MVVSPKNKKFGTISCRCMHHTRGRWNSGNSWLFPLHDVQIEGQNIIQILIVHGPSAKKVKFSTNVGERMASAWSWSKATRDRNLNPRCMRQAEGMNIAEVFDDTIPIFHNTSKKISLVSGQSERCSSSIAWRQSGCRTGGIQRLILNKDRFPNPIPNTD